MRTVTCFMAMFLTVALVTSANAGTLTQRLITFNGGIIQLGGDLDSELSDVLDNIYTYGVGVQLPMNEYFSLLGGIQRSTTSLKADEIKGDITALEFSGGVRLQMPLQQQPITPFVAGLYGHNISDLKLKSGGESSKAELTAGKITIAAGAEWSLSDRLSIMGSFARIMEQSSTLKVNGEKFDLGDEGFDTDSTDVISASVSYWMSDTVLLSGLVALEREEKTKTFQASIGFMF